MKKINSNQVEVPVQQCSYTVIYRVVPRVCTVENVHRVDAKPDEQHGPKQRERFEWHNPRQVMLSSSDDAIINTPYHKQEQLICLWRLE